MKQGASSKKLSTQKVTEEKPSPIISRETSMADSEKLDFIK